MDNKICNLKRLLYYDDNIKNELNKIMGKLIIGKKYKYVGTFSNKMKYITDIDVANFAISYKCKSFKHHVERGVKNIVSNLPDNVSLLYLTTGYHPDLQYEWTIKDKDTIEGYDSEKTKEMLKLLYDYKKIGKDVYDKFLKDIDKPKLETLIYLEELFDKKSRITWNKEEILSGKKEMLGRTFRLKEALFTLPLKNYIRYVWKYKKNIYILVDVSIYYKGEISCLPGITGEPIKRPPFYRMKSLYLMYYNDECYWLLRESKYLFKELYKSGVLDYDKVNVYLDNINDITENALGKYKFMYNKLLDLYKIMRNNGIKMNEVKLILEEISQDIKEHIKNKKIVKMMDDLIKNFDKLNVKEKNKEVRAIANEINRFMNDIMYDEMKKYYKILFEYDNKLKDQLPPILEMSKTKQMKRTMRRFNRKC